VAEFAPAQVEHGTLTDKSGRHQKPVRPRLPIRPNHQAIRRCGEGTEKTKRRKHQDQSLGGHGAMGTIIAQGSIGNLNE
jgi:hypothetical protein